MGKQDYSLDISLAEGHLQVFVLSDITNRVDSTHQGINIRSPKLKPTELYKHKIHVVCTLPQYGLLNKFKPHDTTESFAKLEFSSSKKDIKFQRNLSIDILNVIGIKV